MKNGTVKQFLDALNEMRRLYPFEDDSTRICTRNIVTGAEDALSIITTDKESGIVIEMTKPIHQER